MRTLLLGAAAAAAMMTPGLANANTSGNLALSYENTDYDGGSDFDAYSLGGAVVHGMSNGMTVQLDGRTTLQDWSFSHDSHGYAAAHLSTDMAGWDVGGFAGALNWYGLGATMIGVEGRTSFGNISLDGSIGHTDFGDVSIDGTSYRAGGAYFFSPNLALTAGASFTDIDAGASTEVTELSLGGAYQFANNVELFGGYTNTDADAPVDYDADTWRFGVRFNLNGGSLQDNANDGAWTSAEHIANTWMRW